MDRHRVDADPDLDFHFDANPDPDPDWHQNDPDPNVEFYTSWKTGGIINFFSQQCQFTFILSQSGTSVCDFKHFFGSILKFSGKK